MGSFGMETILLWNVTSPNVMNFRTCMGHYIPGMTGAGQILGQILGTWEALTGPVTLSRRKISQNYPEGFLM